jgi:hypothetical protein
LPAISEKGSVMKQGSTIVLRGVVALIGLVVIVLCIYVVPAGIASDNTGDYVPILYGLYVPAIPFIYALYQTMKLLNFIDKDEAFSDHSVKTLKTIKYCAFTISALFLAGSPYIFKVADSDDAPGVVALALVIVFASFVIATFAAVLQSLIQSAVDIKSENDLTV